MVIVGCKEGKEVQGEELKVVYEGAGDTAVLKSRLYDEPTISRQSLPCHFFEFLTQFIRHLTVSAHRSRKPDLFL